MKFKLITNNHIKIKLWKRYPKHDQSILVINYNDSIIKHTVT